MAAITLQNFEQHIPRAILERSQALLRAGAVHECTEESPGEWVASVQDSTQEPNTVYIGLEGNTLEHWECTCPQEEGSICVHAAAVLLKLKFRGTSVGRGALSRIEALAKARAMRLSRQRGSTAPAVSAPPPAEIPAAPAPPLEPLLAVYAKLPATAKQLVKLAALAWEPVSLTKFTEVFNSADLKHEGLNLYSRDAQPLLNSLVQERLLVRSDSQFRCPPGLADALCERYFSLDPDFRKLAAAIRREMALPWYFTSGAVDRLFREMRLAFYEDSPDKFRRFFQEVLLHGKSQYNLKTLLAFWLPEAFDPAVLERMPPKVRAVLLQDKLSYQFFFLTPEDDYFRYVAAHLRDFEEASRRELARILGLIYALQGNFAALSNLADMQGGINSTAFTGIVLLLEGKIAASLEVFALAQKALRRETRKNKDMLRGLPGIFQVMAQFGARDTTLYPAIENHTAQSLRMSDSYLPIWYALNAVLVYRRNDPKTARKILDNLPVAQNSLVRFFVSLCQYWVDEKIVSTAALESLEAEMRQNGYRWLAAEALALRRALLPYDAALMVNSTEESAELGVVPLLQLLPKVERWESVLDLLQGLKKRNSPAAAEPQTRLVWLVDFERKNLQAKEQTFGKKGWTSGRSVADYRLSSGDIPCMTEQDRRIADAIGYHGYYRLGGVEEVWKALVGHPLLFLWNNPDIGVQLVLEQPQIIVRQAKSGYDLAFSPPIEAAGFKIVKETPTRYKLLLISAEQARLAQLFQGPSLFVPEKGGERLREAIEGLGAVLPVQAVFDVENLPEVVPDTHIWVHLLPVGNGFHVELFVKPFATVPPYLKPGEGTPEQVALIGGERVRTMRDLKAERKEVKRLLDAVALLGQMKPQHYAWELPDTDQCLHLLAQLHPLVTAGDIRLEWPKGEQFKIARVANFDDLRLRVGSGQEWFEVEGDIQVDDTTVLRLQDLLTRASAAQQFVEISPGRFLALTQELRRRLRQLDPLLARHKNGELRLHRLAATALDDLAKDLSNTDFDSAFTENRERLRTAFAQKFALPKSFNAQLRDYQHEGFNWLSRCAAAGLGACLADDMGLGKTVQALAFLSNRAQLGPALVAAPASVCRNWVAETQKFAPALRPILFGEGDRAAVIEQAGKGDLLIVTYDLMARESNHFIPKRFATIVLDEAQAVKNRVTKRSETAMQLQGDFRMIMTGTPLENHLGELWNLFQFINPGLLGSLEHFNDRFAIPIEKNRDDERREALKRLVQPFILRRRKDEVLRELPAKTEITLTVELSPGERAFYEALRRNALAALEADTDSGAGEKHLRILAEIMRLRRAACHPALVDANAGFKTSAKLDVFGEVLDELLENGHKALVFSQFVGHLEIIETYLKKRQIRYQYLDGQTPLATRQKRIEAFQAGDGDLFLISLKAGGTGLNLTAADYVIHLDPWWNPAVEDQATDRAHRIGQAKPVTVYRIVAEKTIEEKILQLHTRKRDLADSLLSGADMSAKLSADELMALIRDAG